MATQAENQRTKTDKETLFKKISSLQKEDETLYNILAVDVWAMAKTMDEFEPGFWDAFMKNREKSLKRFIAEVIKNKSSNQTTSKRPPFLR